MRASTSILAILLAACGNGGGSDCTAGTQGCECTPAGLCDPPNTCLSGVCTAPASDTSTDAPGDTSTDTATEDVAEEVECTADWECDDLDPCTTDSCDMDYNTCTHSDVDADGDGYAAWEVDGTPCGGNDCHDDNMGIYVGECTGINACCNGCYQLDHCWEDIATGYIWEDPPSATFVLWDAAVSYCNALALPGRGAGQWHLPTVAEMRTFIRGCPATQTGGGCIVNDTTSPWGSACDGCLLLSGPGTSGCYWDPDVGGTCSDYWTATMPSDATDLPVDVGFEYGLIGNARRALDGNYVRCVHTP